MKTFLQLAAEKKYSKNGAARILFGPSYFVTALGPNRCSRSKGHCIGLVHTWEQTAAYGQKIKKIKRYNKPVLLDRRKQISSRQVLPAIEWPHQHRMGNSCHRQLGLESRRMSPRETSFALTSRSRYTSIQGGLQ